MNDSGNIKTGSRKFIIVDGNSGFKSLFSEPFYYEYKTYHSPIKKHQGTITSIKIKRNAPCPCGSGIKYKKCCLIKKG